MPLSGPPDLTELLAALRADGIPVGPAELTRLHHAFQGAPRLDREGLRPFLACLLAKTPGQRTLFDQRFDTWCPDLPAEWEAEPQVPPARSNVPRAAEQTARAEPEPFERPEPVAPPRRWLPVALLLTAVLAYLLWQPTRGPVRVEEPAGKAVTLPEVPDTGHALPANPAPRVWYWRAKILPVEVPSRLAAEELAVIALLAGLLAGGLWWRYRRRTPPPPRLPPTTGGPDWLPLPPVAGSDTSLLDPRERRGLVWSIGRFAAEDLTRDLESPLRRGHVARLLRQLRPWPHLALVDFGPPGRLASLVRPYGLRVVRPRDLAGWLGGREGVERPAPGPALQGDLRLWAAACCLGTDPPDTASAQRLRERLGLALDAWAIRDLQRDAGESALRWPEPRRRALVNWLLRAGALDGRGIPAEGSPAALAIGWWRQRYRDASREQGTRENRLLPWTGTGAQRRWALEDALLALCLKPEWAAWRLFALKAGDPVVGDEIRARLAGLRAADQPPGEGRDRATETAVYLTWRLGDLPPRVQDALARLGFGGAELGRRHRGPRPPPRLGLALGLLAGFALAAAGAAGYRWLRPPGIELSSVEPIHDRPTLKAQTLRLVDGKTGRVVVGSAKGTLSTQVPPGARVPVAWDWGPGEGDNNPVRLRDKGEALVFRAGTLPQPIRPCGADWPARSLAVVQSDPAAEPARRLAIRLLDSGTADQVLVTADWQQDLERFTGEDPLLNANTRFLVILPAEPFSGGNGGDERVGWAERSEAQHPASPNESIVGSPASAQPTGAGATSAMPQVAAQSHALVTADYDRLAAWLDFPGTRELARAPVRVLASRGDMPWHGGPEQMPDAHTGIDWVRVCPGTFTMGSDPETDPMSQKDERPAHPVALAAFDIARTETTNGQYRRFRAGQDSGKADDLPAVNVRWKEARDFCEHADGDLPTEAQWEQAARGGSMAPWSFGADEKLLAQHAWYDESYSGEAHAVAGKRPNPLGLYDMHGNVQEWARDRYGPYAAGLQADPDGASGGEYKVHRGGFFEVPPAFLRSASRGNDHTGPLYRHSFRGFRCVRVVSPQH